MTAKHILKDLAALLCVVFTAEVPAQLPNAWQITDNSTAGGSAINYTTNLPADLRIAATNLTGGFRFAVNARFVTDFEGTKAMAMAYGLGTKRFFIWLELGDNGNLTAELEGSSTFALTANGSGTLLYHTHEIIYDPASGHATYLFDGQSLTTNWTGSGSALTAGQIFWGSGSSAGQGQMNFHSVSFQVTNTVVASYHAGTSGNPVTAPEPKTLGWTISIENPAPGASVTNISPDTTLLAVATTLAADQFTPISARLNGHLNPRGSQTRAWFEWGTDTNYGNATAMQAVGSGGVNVSVPTVLNGLTVGPDYHFRLVASNAFGLVMGVDRVFDLNFSPPSATTLSAEPVINAPGIRLRGLVNPNDLPTDAWFEWGTNSTYGNTTPITDMGQANLDTNLTRLLLSIPNGGDYHYRVLASNAFGLVTGSDASFNVSFLTRKILNRGGVYSSSVAWADYNRDGRLDVLIEGDNAESDLRPLYINLNPSALEPVSASSQYFEFQMNPILDGSVAWADYNNDGLPDILLTGNSYGIEFAGNVSQLWQNTGVGLTHIPLSELQGVRSSSVAWGDYDNDGRPDFLLTGILTNLSRISQLWRNTGVGFTHMAVAGLPGVSVGSVAWADYDNDGDMDFLLTGNTNASQPGGISQLWQNIGNEFVPVPIPDLPGVFGSSVAWADYDNDGRLDFLITGRRNISSSSAVSQLWRNTGNGFVYAPIPDLPGVFDSSVAWADYDNDGRQDFLITGRLTASTAVSQLWRNTGDGFTSMPISGLPGVGLGSISWADYDNDGRVDFVLTGTTNGNVTGAISRLFRNYALATNNPPSAPSALASSFSNGWTHLSWSPATDAQTPSAGLSYNIRVGSAPGGEDVVSSLALTNGFRLVPALGNAQMRSHSILNLAPGAYYWSVQGVDTAFAGGPFAPEASFVVPGPALSIVLSNSSAVISWEPSYPGWILQQSASLNPAAWTNTPSGATNTIAVPTTAQTQFYRLIKL